MHTFSKYNTLPLLKSLKRKLPFTHHAVINQRALLLQRKTGILHLSNSASHMKMRRQKQIHGNSKDFNRRTPLQRAKDGLCIAILIF